MPEPSTIYEQAATLEIEEADRALNRDAHWTAECRRDRAVLHLMRAQVYATLELAQNVADLRRHGLPVERVP